MNGVSKQKYVTNKQIDRKLVQLRKRDTLPARLIEELRKRLGDQKLTSVQLKRIIREISAAMITLWFNLVKPLGQWLHNLLVNQEHR